MQTIFKPTHLISGLFLWVAMLHGCGFIRKTILAPKEERFTGFDPQEFLGQNTPADLLSPSFGAFHEEWQRAQTCFAPHAPILSAQLRQAKAVAQMIDSELSLAGLLPTNISSFPDADALEAARKEWLTQGFGEVPPELALQREVTNPLFVRALSKTQSHDTLPLFALLDTKFFGKLFDTVASAQASGNEARTGLLSAAEHLARAGLTPQPQEVKLKVAKSPFLTRSVYARFLGTPAPYQLLVQCVQTSVQRDTPLSVPMAVTWPRIIILEQGTLTRDTSRTVAIYPTLGLDSTIPDSLPKALIGFTEQTRRTEGFITSIYSRSIQDGAASGELYKLFRESRTIFFSRFFGSLQTPNMREHSFATFQLPVNKTVFEATTQRTQAGVAAGPSTVQDQWWTQETKDGSAFPKDRWFDLRGPMSLDANCMPRMADKFDDSAQGIHTLKGRKLPDFLATVDASGLPFEVGKFTEMCEQAFAQTF